MHENVYAVEGRARRGGWDGNKWKISRWKVCRIIERHCVQEEWARERARETAERKTTDRVEGNIPILQVVELITSLDMIVTFMPFKGNYDDFSDLYCVCVCVGRKRFPSRRKDVARRWAAAKETWRSTKTFSLYFASSPSFFFFFFFPVYFFVPLNFLPPIKRTLIKRPNRRGK